ncbi:MAG: tetrahydrofolate dehydrogenase/cyclohydrolase catalytic domain-containing protein [Candidatus Diapherotrites archaeon]
MLGKILDGTALAEKIYKKVAEDVKKLREKGINPCLAVVQVGSVAASNVYVKKKQEACAKTGLVFRKIGLQEPISEAKLIGIVDELNNDESVNGIIVQLPLPKNIDETKIMRTINPMKDADGFHPTNIGKMFINREFLLPATPKGVIELLEGNSVKIEGEEVCVVGRSNVVGKPLAVLFMNRNATVTVCHKLTKDLKAHTINADIIAVAVGKPKLITADMVKEGVVVVDIGINRLPNGKLCGDVDFDGVKKKASLITPVPGGAGPMTVASLLENVVIAAKKQNGVD